MDTTSKALSHQVPEQRYPMTQKANWKATSAFETHCMEILNAYPEAIGVAYKGLDCGCALVCGVSAASQPLGQLRHLSGQPKQTDRRPPHLPQMQAR